MILCVLLIGATIAGPAYGVRAQTGTQADAGSVIVVDASDQATELSEGDSSTAFTLRLPADAACPGDSYNDGWLVQSFIVPEDTDIGSMRYELLQPEGDGYRALRSLDGNIFTQAATNPNDGPGMPGQLLPPPPLTFAWYQPGILPAGRYKMGIACTPSNWEVERFWDVEVDLALAPDVDPGGLRWTVVSAGPDSLTVSAPESAGDGGTWLAVVVVAGGLGALVLLVFRRRSRVPPTNAKDLA